MEIRHEIREMWEKSDEAAREWQNSPRSGGVLKPVGNTGWNQVYSTPWEAGGVVTPTWKLRDPDGYERHIGFGGGGARCSAEEFPKQLELFCAEMGRWPRDGMVVFGAAAIGGRG